jgi:hypothetical protein
VVCASCHLGSWGDSFAESPGQYEYPGLPLSTRASAQPVLRLEDAGGRLEDCAARETAGSVRRAKQQYSLSPVGRGTMESALNGKTPSAQVVGTTSLYENGQIRLIPVSSLSRCPWRTLLCCSIAR